MKYSIILPFGFCLGEVMANIDFKIQVTLNCNPDDKAYTGCLRGQRCTEEWKCESGEQIWPLSFRSDPAQEPVSQTFSPDGRCGSKNGGLICNADSTVYKGTCCSSSGWCGDTPVHCETGCQSGCTNSAPAKTDLTRSDGRCGVKFLGATCDKEGPLGGCCSSAGYCGVTSVHCQKTQGCQSGCTESESKPKSPRATISAAEPVPDAPISTPLNPRKVTTDPDGKCGASFNNVLCGDFPRGSCCSMYGFCGKTSAHCGAGCQSGPCLGPAVVPAPGPSPAPAATIPGTIKVVGQSGVPPMHAALMPNGRVMFLDKVEKYSQLKLANGQFAYSAEYDPVTNRRVPLRYETNAFCSGGTFLADGRLVSIGGNKPLKDVDPTVGDGFQSIRYLSRSSSDPSRDGQSWSEPGNQIDTARWYASVQTMPDGTVFVASGSLNGLDPTAVENNNPTYEVLNSEGITNGESIPLVILSENQPYYMYPFIHLLSNGDLFIFVSKVSEVFNVAGNSVLKILPDLPGDYRTYPNTGGSVLLPLHSSNGYAPDIMICGGGVYQDINSATDPSCGRIQPLSATPKWEMDSMPEGRGMVEGTLLPDGTVIWLNGCNKGAQGFGIAANPTLEVLIYNPAEPLGQRFHTGPSSTIARLYHSVALLLLDGNLMIAGSNPVEQPILVPVPNKTPSEDFVTEFRIEIYTPPYLQGARANRRPTAVRLSSKVLHANGSGFTISFNAPSGAEGAQVALYHGGFVTHSLHMGHRMIILDSEGFESGIEEQNLSITMPPNRNIAPPGPYVIYVTVDGVPAIGQFVSVS